ncbi:MAG: hypothetical protein G01um101438_24 [Parcubacteria group bacterium Gr01-1014_38]|nr:MAG: hypothetical protein G01um101438_24 [Parcubacteria group bacterium Gr01-1014_38]
MRSRGDSLFAGWMLAVLVCAVFLAFGGSVEAAQRWEQLLDPFYDFSIPDLLQESRDTIGRTYIIDGLQFGVTATRKTEGRWNPFSETKVSGIVVHVYAGNPKEPQWVLSSPESLEPNREYRVNVIANGKTYAVRWKGTRQGVQDWPRNLGGCRIWYEVFRSDTPIQGQTVLAGDRQGQPQPEDRQDQPQSENWKPTNEQAVARFIGSTLGVLFIAVLVIGGIVIMFILVALIAGLFGYDGGASRSHSTYDPSEGSGSGNGHRGSEGGASSGNGHHGR